jgi:hypothetical protein
MMTTAHGRHADDQTAELPSPLVGEPADAEEVDLASDPFADDLTEQLKERAPRRLVTRTTAVLGAVLLVVAGFLGGVQVQKHWGKSGSQTTNPFGNMAGFPTAGTSGFPDFGANQGGGLPGGTASGPTTGTVKLVDGDTIYIQTTDGRTVTVKTTGDTSVRVSQAGSLKDLNAGATVSVEGSTGSDGTVTATAVTRTK